MIVDGCVICKECGRVVDFDLLRCPCGVDLSNLSQLDFCERVEDDSAPTQSPFMGYNSDLSKTDDNPTPWENMIS